MSRDRALHVLETIALVFVGGSLNFAEPLLVSGHPGDAQAFWRGAAVAGVAAVIARVRGLQLGVLLGASLPDGYRSMDQVTPAETPFSKGKTS